MHESCSRAAQALSSRAQNCAKMIERATTAFTEILCAASHQHLGSTRKLLGSPTSAERTGAFLANYVRRRISEGEV